MNDTPDTSPTLAMDGAIATIQLNRPRQANRIEHGDLDVLHQHVKQITENAAIRAVILTGVGKHFSAGYDLTSILSTVEEDPTLEFATNPFGLMVDAFESLPQPVICALNGGVYGGATDLALACDLRLGVPHTKMFMPAAGLGLHYYLSGMKRYVSRLGFNTAKRLFLFAESMDATQMLHTGFLDRIVAAEDLETEAQKTAQSVASMAPLAIQGMKQALNSLAHGELDPDLFAKTETMCLRSNDIREGVNAWREKRSADFKGN